jgi:hypothetical protein
MAGTASSAISRFSFHHSRDTHQTQSYTCVLWTSPHAQRPELVRYLLTRLRATDDSLFVRCRLGTNPGGPYADWQMKLFLGGACPHCEPPVHIPGQIYNDAVWPSDDRSLEGMTTQFIFSRVTDHNLLGEKVHSPMSGCSTRQLQRHCWPAAGGPSRGNTTTSGNRARRRFRGRPFILTQALDL